MMDFSVNFLYVCLLFPLWVLLLVWANTLFTSISSRRLTLVFTLISSFLPLVFSLMARANNVDYSDSLIFFSINNININFGLILNKLNLLLTAIFSLLLILVSIFAYFEFKEKDYYLKFFMFINCLNFCGLSFLFSSNLLQLIAFAIFIPILFYIVENMMNDSHERAKNFLVMNKIGDFTLLIPVCALFYNDILFNFSQSDSMLNLKDLPNLFDGFYSVSETQIFILVVLMFTIGILIKSILVLIHPLKDMLLRFLLIGWNMISFSLAFVLLFPILTQYDETKIFIYTFSIFIFALCLLVLLMKKYCHSFVTDINNSSFNVVKNVYMNLCNAVRVFDSYVLDKLYDWISKITLIFANCFKTTGNKNTIWALLFNIIGIIFLVLVAWLLYYWILRG